MAQASTADRGSRAIVVLGCRAVFHEDRLLGPLGRRVTVAATLAQRDGAGTLVVASGGRAWGPWVEADAMARALGRLGVPAVDIVRERCSLDTRDNARYSAALLARRGVARVLLVTCASHMPRALWLFVRQGLTVQASCVPESGTTRAKRAWRAVRERASFAVDRRLVGEMSP